MSTDASLLKELKHRAARIRWLSLKATSEAGSGHPTSCCSAADILSVLFFNVMRYEVESPESDANDRLVLSKGHAAPALYAAWCEAGYLKESELMELRKMNSRIEGHPMPSLPFVDVATGSLGQGLAAGMGIALHQSKVLKNDARTFVLLGDGEMAEGSIWEAFALSGHLHIENLTAVVDVNRLGQSCETMHGHDLLAYAKKIESFGWEAMIVEDGHDHKQLMTHFSRALKVCNKPVCLLAKTYKGYGVSEISDKNGWHGKPIPKGPQLDKALAEVAADFMKTPPAAVIPRAASHRPLQLRRMTSIGNFPRPPYDVKAKVATRQAVGEALIELGKHDERIWVMDGDTQNSTYALKFAEAYPERFLECFIAEQNMVGISAGLASRGMIPFACTFGAFLARAFDQARMAALSGLGIKLVGTHAGISIGEDGPSQMALEDLAAFRTLPNGVVFYPADAVSAYYLILQLALHKGPGYIRLSRPAAPILYPLDEQFQPGEIKILNKASAPKLTVVSAGVILHEVIKAVKEIGAQNAVQVVDLYSVKPFPKGQLLTAVKASGGRLAVFEEHAYEGGIGEACAANLAGHITEWVHTAVGRVPRSGPPAELLASFGLSAKTIGDKLKSLI